VPAGPPTSTLFNAAGLARQLRASPLLAFGPSRAGPALRRGALIAIPIGLCLAVELGLDTPTKGTVATGALLAGFPGLDAPARPRAAWQAVTAPVIGLAAVLGILSSQTAPAGVLAMGLVGAAAGYCFSVSLRLAIAGLAVALSLVIAQGFFLAPGDAWPALLYVTGGGLLQAAWSLTVWLVAEGAARDEPSGWNSRETRAALASNLTLRSSSARHALRFGAALAAGVATYRVLDLHDHGFWIPLTILFVMRPDREETDRRLVLRAIGTVLGLVAATAIAESVGGYDLVVALALTVAAALSFGLLTVQYALFTAAITTYVVLLTDTLGEAALQAAGQRALGTAIGIAIAFLAFLAWPNPGERGRAMADRQEPSPAPPEAAAR
jgi:hypothetical protein